jgi:hypothetical protein
VVTAVPTQCLVGRSRADYDDWGLPTTPRRNSLTASVDPGVRELDAGASGVVLRLPAIGAYLVVRGVKPELRSVQVQPVWDVTAPPVWVNADALECEQGSTVADYQPMRASPSCPPGDARCVSPTARVLLDRARAYASEVARRSTEDHRRLVEGFFDEQLSDQDRCDMLTAAVGDLDRAYHELADAGHGLGCADARDPSKVRFEIPFERDERACRTFRDAAALGTSTAQACQSNPRAAVLGLFLQNCGPFHADRDTGADVAYRTMLYHALGLHHASILASFPARKRLRDSLDYVVPRTGYIASDEVFGGYLYGATGHKLGDPVDCAAFALHYLLGMKQAAVADQSRESPTVFDFEAIHDYLRAPALSMVPRSFRAYVNCFEVVDPRLGQAPQPGDLVSSAKHIVVVDRYDVTHRKVVTLEASSTPCESVCTMSRPLFEPTCGGDTQTPSLPALRGDLRILRLAPHPPADGRSSACPITALPSGEVLGP